MRAAPIPSARKATPVSPIPARTTATRKDPRRRAISRRGGTVSTKMTRNPSARRKTTTPYRPAAARSGRAAISRPMAALAIILWRALQHMPNVDGFAPSEILHFPPSEPSRPDGTDFVLVPHRNFVAGPDLASRVSDSDREDVAHREEVVDLDAVGVLRAEEGVGQCLVYDRCFRPEVRDHGVVPVRRQEGREVFDHDRGLVAAPVPRHGDVIIPRGVKALQLPRDESQGRGDDDLVDDGRVRSREDRVAEPTVAAARRVGLARGTGEEE